MRYVKEKKKEWINNRIREIEEADKKNDTQKLYTEIKNLNNEKLPTVLICKDVNGKILSDKI
jgi:transposase-like protein